MKIKSCVRGIGLWVVALTLILSPWLVYADCVIVGTIDGGYIVACTGTDTDGFCIGASNDIITVEPGAAVSHAVQQFVEAIASANAIAIDAGGGNNQVTNFGSVGATAEATALPEDGSASQATATSTAIKTGDNLDVIQNFLTITSTATANSESGAVSMVPDLSDLFNSATAEATAKGIDAGSDGDQIVNSGTINATAEANADLTDILLPPLGSKTLALPPRATALSTGIEGGAGNDEITNSGTVNAIAVSSSESVDISLTLDLEGGAKSEATAVGIHANEGDDKIINSTAINAEADATASSDAVVLNLLSIGTSAAPTTATASSTGIDSGKGADNITNNGNIIANATSTAKALSVTVTALQYEVASTADARTESVASATGISGGDGDDQVTNTGTVTATANATASTTDISVEYMGAARGNSSTTSDAFATGIDGGVGKDDISNSSAIAVNATSEVHSLSIEVKRNEIPLDPLEWAGADLDDARTAAQAKVIGIKGGDGDDTITNSGTIDVYAYAKASSDAIVVEVSIPLESDSNTPKASKSNIDLKAPIALGAAGITAQAVAEAQENSQGGNAIANAGTIAQVTAMGIAGGTGNDFMTSSDKVSGKAEAEADSLSIGVAISYERSEFLDILGMISIADTTTTAQATAAGVDGGAGNDTLTNTNELSAEANSNATSTAIKAHLQGDFKKDKEGGFEYEIGASLVECGTESTAIATGIAGGDGNDSIINSGKVIAKAVSDADSTSVATTLMGAGEGLVAGFSYADATTTAEATATGIDGGTGNNSLNNTREIEVTAESTSTSISVGVTVTGVTKDKGIAASVALTDGTTKAISTAAGMKGADGADTITSSGKIKTTATSDADSTSISASIAGTKEGLAVGVTYADATTTADAKAIGIDGGAGDDDITNESTGNIEVTADPTSSSASIGVTVSGGFSQEWSAAVGVAIADGTTKAISNVTGISGADGEDAITNFGKITAKALPDADSASVSATLTGAQDGLTLGFTYADNTTTAEANAVGIDGGADNDIITNTSTGEIEVTADPTSSSASVSATVSGVTKGTGIVGGAALTDGTTKAISNIAGIKGGEDDDTITNSGKIIVKSNPDADSASVSVNLGAALGELGLVGGFSYADATTTAQATATGIEGGAGNDTITSTGEIEVTTEPTASSASIGVTAQGVKGMGAAVGISLADGTTTAIATATGIAGGEGNDTINNLSWITVKALPDADSASVSVSLSAAKEGVAAGGTFTDATTTAQATATGIDGGEGNDAITNSGTIGVTADSESSSASVSVSAEGTMTGAALGVALSDGTTKAISKATGIKSGGGNDTITNYHITTVTSTADIDSASVTVNLGGAQTGLVAGVAAADVTTTAESAATGIRGDSGDDTIENLGLVSANATSTISAASVSVNAGVAVSGAAVGAALADGKTVATSSAIGLEGGEGSDTLTNRGLNVVSAKSDVTAASVAVNLEGTKAGLAGGVSLVDGENNASALAIGISGGSGHDTIGNDTGGFLPYTWVEATTTSTRTNVSVTGNFSLYGAALGASFADATNIATADARGIEGGEGDDKITNTSFLNSVATTTADTTSVSFSANVAIFGAGVGASLASAETTGNAFATGISGGEGNDEIKNMSSGVITATSTATAKAKAISVDISYASFSTADATTTASADSSGITGGSGQDFILNEGTIDLGATSSGDGVAGTGTLTGYGAAKVDVNSWATTTGIDGGTEDDTITNRNEITTLSNATAKGRSISVNLLGAVFAEAGTNAHAITNGLSGGAGGDQVTNEGSIDLTATSNADLTGVSVQLFGYSNSDGSSLSEAIAVGIDGGDGENTLTNTSAGSIKATTTAYADTASVSVNLAGAVKADAGSTGSATAIGIAAGKENDSIRNEGTVNLSSTSDTEASATEVTLIGYGDSSAKAVSAATVKGIDGGDGANTITNSSGGTITGTATALADASSYDIKLSGGGKAKAGTEATATAIGISGGKNTDILRNKGTINFAAGSTLVSESRSYKIIGVGFADADSKAEAIATGIDGGHGANTITNASTGSITVSSNASATATSMTANIGVAGSSASTTSKAHSTGMKSGDDQDTIFNEGNINVTATSSTGAAGGDFSLIGLSFGNSLTEALTEGIHAGGGNDTIVNTGFIAVGGVQDNDHPMAYSEVASVSFSFFGISSATFGSKAQATGIVGGHGDDAILNTGSITVGDDDWMAKGRAYGFSGNFFEFFSLTSVGTTAETVATGMDGGDGNDTLLNDTGGVLIVKATSYAEAEGAGDTTFGSPAAFASSTTKATATGISGGEGNDLIENKGAIDADAHTLADAYSDSFAGWGSPSADSTANATATAVGVGGGKGQTLITNSGVVTVKALAETRLYAKANSDIDTTDAEVTSYSRSTAFGIQAGDDGNTVNNTATGAITVTATARTYDAQGNIAKAESDEEATVIAGSVNSPITANAVGISLGNGDDTVANDGIITVSSLSDARGSAYSNSWPYDAQSDATAYAAATGKGIAVGVGANEVVNNGQINVSAWSHANPITDSWSRDQTAIANATAGSNAVAIGIEADGDMINTSLGNIYVTARATTYADANTEAETTTATATLMATATGLGTTSSAGRTARDWLWNDGNITVTAVAGEDENGNNEEIAYADTDTWVRSCTGTATGTSTVDATGIRVGERGAEITNNGNLEVFGRARAYVRAYADSRDYNPRGNAYSTGIATATGISAAGGHNLINNYSTMKVEARVQDAYTRGDTWSSWSTCRSLAETNATATATGIQTGAGIDEINSYGQLTVVADSDSESYAWADTRDNNLADEYETTTATAQADAIGIDAGAGNNLVNHSGSMSVSAEANARAGAGGGHASVTRTEQAVSSAVGIQAGSGDDSIVITSVSNLVATAKGTANDADVRATGIDAGDGINILQSQSSISAVANATAGISAEAEVWGIKTGSSSDGIVLGTGSLINTAANATSSSDNGVTNASAIGIDVGDGANQITNHGTISVFGDADAEVRREEILWLSITYPATAVSNVTGIKSGQGADIINNYGEIMVNSKASAVINQVLDLSAGTKSATANATGIDAGDGDNIVTNYGSINVSALAAAGTGANPNSRTDGVETTTAIGIKTGDGNDTIINSGSITTRNQRLEWVGGWIHFVDWPGIAITSGAGSDQVFLLDGSETNGHIDLGEGDDWLTFTGTPVVTGDVTGGAGADTLVFEGTGSIGFTPMAFENAIKQGAGIFSVSNLPTMQRIEVNRGTLEIDNNYQFASDGTLAIQINGRDYGQIRINGQAELDGSLYVIATKKRAYKNGDTFDILTATDIVNKFDTFDLPSPKPLRKFDLHYLENPDRVQMEAHTKKYTTVAKNRVEGIIANYLDRIMPLADDDLSEVLAEIQSLSEPGEFNTAFSSLSPMSYDNYTRGTLFTAQQYAKSLRYRMNNVRSHIRAGSPENQKPLLAYSGSDASVSQLFSSGEFSQVQGKSGLWLDAFGQWGDQDEEDGFTGYDYFLRGATLGFDHRLTDMLMAGLSLGYSRSDIDLEGNQGSGDVKSLFGSLYGSYFDKNLYVDAILSYGWNWYDNSRLVTIGGILREATSEHDGQLFSGYLGGGYYFDFNPLFVGPYGSLQYVYLDEDSYKEKGAGGVSLRVDDRQTDALVSELGLRMVGRFKGKCGSFLPEVSLGWSYDFDIDDHVVRASFAGSPGASFSIEGHDVERNSLVVGGGLTFIHQSGFSTSFRYKGDFRGDYKSNAVMGEIRFSF